MGFDSLLPTFHTLRLIGALDLALPHRPFDKLDLEAVFKDALLSTRTLDEVVSLELKVIPIGNLRKKALPLQVDFVLAEGVDRIHRITDNKVGSKEHPLAHGMEELHRTLARHLVVPAGRGRVRTPNQVLVLPESDLEVLEETAFIGLVLRASE